MMQQQDPFKNLVIELTKLPGVGERSATRMAHFLVKKDVAFVQQMVAAILRAKESIHLCLQCFHYAEGPLCGVCLQKDRLTHTWCVVERSSDLQSIEATGRYFGLYHVLHGVLSPLDGIGPDELKIKELILRIENAPHKPEEIILALNSSVEGEATSSYISKLLRSYSIKISRLAFGLPVGSSLEYADRLTIGKALENRVSYL